jgi:proline utilization trans-activator
MRHFRQRLNNTYRTPDSAESKDRLWLCKLLVVLALAESVNSSRQTGTGRSPNEQFSPVSDQDSVSTSIPPAGSDYFEQSLRLLNIPYESATIDHIETLNLMVSPDLRNKKD